MKIQLVRVKGKKSASGISYKRGGQHAAVERLHSVGQTGDLDKKRQRNLVQSSKRNSRGGESKGGSATSSESGGGKKTACSSSGRGLVQVERSEGAVGYEADAQSTRLCNFRRVFMVRGKKCLGSLR